MALKGTEKKSYMKGYYLENMGRIKDYTAEWKLRNPEKAREQADRRNARTASELVALERFLAEEEGMKPKEARRKAALASLALHPSHPSRVFARDAIRRGMKPRRRK